MRAVKSSIVVTLQVHFKAIFARFACKLEADRKHVDFTDFLRY